VWALVSTVWSTRLALGIQVKGECWVAGLLALALSLTLLASGTSAS
jgi:hypothetical protein